MNETDVEKVNNMIADAYKCLKFIDFLKFTVCRLHELVLYDSGMFFCAISRDSSYFKPYITGNIESYYQKYRFTDWQSFKEVPEGKGNRFVYRDKDVPHIKEEPRSWFLESQDEYHIVCVRIVYEGQFLGEIYLHRSHEKPDFTNRELFILSLLQPHIANIFHMIHTIQALDQTSTNGQMDAKTGLCIFDSALSLVSANTPGIEMLKWATAFGSSVLYHVKELCTGLEQRGSGHHDARKPLVIDVYVKEGAAKQYIIVLNYLNQEQQSDYKLKFSKREAEIIDGLIQGKNNMQLANIFNLSENTIKTHVKNIYKKTGVSNRTELTYLLMLNQ